MLLSLLRVLVTVSMADTSFVHKPENFQVVITFQPNHFSDLFLNQCLHWTFLPLFVASSHELLHSALTKTCSSIGASFGKLYTVKQYLRFNFYYPTNVTWCSKLVLRSDIQKLHTLPQCSILYYTSEHFYHFYIIHQYEAFYQLHVTYKLLLANNFFTSWTYNFYWLIIFSHLGIQENP